MVGRDRREERRDERATFGRGGNAVRYQMREKLMSIGDDSWIEDEAGQRAFKVNGKAVRVRNTLILEDANGRELFKIQDRPVRIKDSMDIEDAGAGTSATVKKALVAPLRDRLSVSVAGGPDMDVQGNLLDHEYEITQGGTKVAEVSKKWFRVRDTYGVEVTPGQNDALILAITVCVDQMAAG
jgi:uncharacterized protein YxjI